MKKEVLNPEVKANKIAIYIKAINEAKNTLHLLEIMFDIDYEITHNNLEKDIAETLKMFVKMRKNELK